MSSSERAPGRRNQLPPVVQSRTQPASRPAGVPAAALETRFFSTQDGKLYRMLPNNQVELFSYGAVANPPPAANAAQQTATQAAANAQAVTNEVVAARTLGGVTTSSLADALALAANSSPLPPAANGDVLYYLDGWKALPPASAGNVLQCNGAAAPSWVTPASAPASGMDAYTRLLLPFDSATAWTDLSSTNHAFTVIGAPQISAARSMFGGASAYFTAGNYLWTLSGPGGDFDFGSGDFTIDCWVNLTDNNQGNIISQWAYGHRAFLLVLGPTTVTFAWGISLVGAGEISNPCVINNNTWYHIAAVRRTGLLSLYVNGISTGAPQPVPAISIDQYRCFVGVNDDGPGAYYCNGYLDELRVSKGIARWLGNFTPPTAAYPTNPI